MADQGTTASAELRFNVNTIVDLPVFDLRNGEIGDVRSMIVRPTIPEAFRWRTIGGIDHTNAKANADLFIRTAWAGLMMHTPEGWSAEKVRKAAFALGAVRCVVTWLFRIVDEDLVAGEKAETILTLVPAAEAGGNPTVRISNSVPQNVRAAIQTAAALTPDERNFVSNVASFGSCVPPLQGLSLVNCQHHYLSDMKSQSFKTFFAVERQFWRGPAVKAMYEEDLDMLRDIIWHKSCHPLHMLLKISLASNERIKDSLVKMQLGAAAARLPAVEPMLRAAQTWMTVMSTVKAFFESYGGFIDYSLLGFVVDTVMAYPVDPAAPRPEIPNSFTVPGTDPPVTYTRPAHVTTRQSAMVWLDTIMTRNTAVVATAYGFYVALSENAVLTGAETVNDTLKGAYSLKKLQSQSMAAYLMGVEAYKDYSSFKARQRSEGKYSPVSLSFSA